MSRHFVQGGGFTTRVGDIGQYTVRVTLPVAQSPFHGAPFSIAPTATTTIQCEDFDFGGEGVSYHDTTGTNLGGMYRTADAVDIKVASDSGGGYRLSDVVAGEWVEYTINVQQTGSYDFGFRVASPDPGGHFHAEIDGANVSGLLSVADTNSFAVFSTVSKTGISLSAGTHVLRLAFDAIASPSGVVGAFNWISIAKTSTSSQLVVGTTTAAHVRDGSFANMNYGSATMLQVKNSPYTSFSRQAYLKFDLTGVNTFSAANLRLFGQTEDSVTHNLLVGVYALNDPSASWMENGLTWNNKPSSSATALASRTITDNVMRMYDFDLTSYLQAQKAAGRTSVTLVVKMASPQAKFVQFASDEAASNQPQLIFTT
jgi:hypothetical protein